MRVILVLFFVLSLQHSLDAGMYKPPKPEVVIKGVKDKQVMRAGRDLEIEAIASVKGDSIMMVDFYVNNKRVGRDFKKPYRWKWKGLPPGQFKIRVQAYARRNKTSTKTDLITVTSR